MKKDIILKEEIGRIHELMNVQPLIVENLDYLFESELIVESILPDLVRAGIDAADNLVKSGKRLSPDIQKYLNDLSSATDNIAKSKAIANLMDESAEIFSSVYSVYLRVNKPLLDTVSTNINKALQNASPQNFKQVQDRLNQIVEIQSRQLTRQIPSQKLATELERGWKKQIRDFDKYRNVTIPTSSIGSKMNDFFTKNIPNLQTVVRQVKNSFFKSFDVLQDRFFELEKIATAKMMNGNPATSELKEMADILGSLNSKWGKDAETVWNSMDVNGQKGWKNVVSDLVEGQLDYKRTGKPWDGVLEALSTTDEKLMTKFEAYKKMAKFYTPDGFARVVAFALYRDPRKPAELMKILAKKGMSNFILWRVWYYFFVFPAIYAFIASLPDITKSTGEGLKYISTGERPEYTTWGDDGWFMTYLKRMGKSFPGDGALGAIAGFIQPTGIWDLISGIDTVMGGFQNKRIDSLRDEAEQDYKEFKDGLSDEDRKKLEDAENEAGLSDESISTGTSTEEEPLTYDPVFKNLFSKYPCLKTQFKNGDIKKLSDTKLKIMGNGSEWTVIIGSDGNASYTEKNGVRINPVPVQCG